jgi:DNA-binding transcriptional regulator YbjK
MAVAVRKRAAERRREIGGAALRIVGREGVTALTTANLAREVHLTTGWTTFSGKRSDRDWKKWSPLSRSPRFLRSRES